VAKKKPQEKGYVIGLTMLVGLLAVITGVGLLFILATKDTTLIKNLFSLWAVTGLFFVLVVASLFRGEMSIPRSKIFLPLAIYFCLGIISTAFSAYRYASVRELMNLSCCGMLLFVTGRAVTIPKRFFLVAAILAGIASVSCLYAISQHYGLDLFFGKEPDLLERGRSFSTMGHPNFFASFLVLALPVSLSLFYSSGNAAAKSLFILLVCAVELSLFYTHSRGAWLGFLGSMPVWFFLSPANKRWRLILLGPIVIVCAGMVLLLLSEGTRGYVILWALPFWLCAVLLLQVSGSEKKLRSEGKPLWGAFLLAAVVLVSVLFVDSSEIGGRMEAAFETEKGSVLARKVIWAGALPMIRARPIFGSGIGTFSIYFPRFRDPATAGKIMPNTLHAHSEYLEIAAEMGVVGLGVFLWMIGAFVWETARKIGHARDEFQAAALAGLLAGCAAILVQATVCVTTRWVVGRFFLWLGMGLTIAVGTMSSPVAPRKQKVRQLDETSQPSQRFYKLNFKPVRAPVLRAAIVSTIVAVMAAGGFWAIRVWNSAVSTARGEGYEVRAERLKTGDATIEDFLQHSDWARAARERAIELYNRAIALNRYNLSAYYKLGHCYNLQGEFDESLRTYLRIAKLSPDYCDIHFNLGTVFMNMQRWEDSRREYETALRMKIGPLTRIGLAGAYMNLQLPDAAREQYDALLKANPNDVRAMNELARLHMRLGENEKAMELSRKALEIDPENADAHLNLGLIHQTLAYECRRRGDEARAAGHFEKSIAELELAVAKRPWSLPDRAALALVYADVGRTDEALSHLRIGLSINPAHPLLHLNLGKVYRRRNEPEQAVEAFRRAVEIDPKGSFGAQARRELKAMGME
jgi:tetratricopeptide (TPR) repeat protein/O-antigen ligase